MKKILLVTTVVASIIAIAIGCKKETTTTVEPTPAYAVAGTEKWESFTYRCINNSGTCGLQIADSREAWIKAPMEPDGVKFDAWAFKDANGNIIIKQNVVDMNLKQESKDWYLVEKKFGFDSTTNLPQDFINAVCKASGLSERPDAKQYYFPTGKFNIKFNRTVGVNEKFNMYWEWRPHPAYPAPVPNAPATDEIVIY